MVFEKFKIIILLLFIKKLNIFFLCLEKTYDIKTYFCLFILQYKINLKNRNHCKKFNVLNFLKTKINFKRIRTILYTSFNTTHENF